MGRYNEILAGRYNKMLTKLLSMKGPAPAPQLAGDIAATFEFFNGVENRYLESWSRYGQVVGLAASAGNTSGVRLRNPANSNVVGVIEKCTISVPLADQPVFRHGTATTDLAVLTGSGGQRKDSRSGAGPNLILSDQNNAAAVPVLTNDAAHFAVFLPNNGFADVMLDPNQEETLLPGDAVQILSNAVNLALNVSIWWRERFLEDSERT
jgi:hypothetical protein